MARSFELFPSISPEDSGEKFDRPDDDDDEDVTYNCGHNGCKRTVDNESDTCWQHP